MTTSDQPELERRFRFAWLAVIVPFHLVTLLTMNIFFWENLPLIAVLFTALTGWIVKARGPAEGCAHATPGLDAHGHTR